MADSELAQKILLAGMNIVCGRDVQDGLHDLFTEVNRHSALDPQLQKMANDLLKMLGEHVIPITNDSDAIQRAKNFIQDPSIVTSEIPDNLRYEPDITLELAECYKIRKVILENPDSFEIYKLGLLNHLRKIWNRIYV